MIQNTPLVSIVIPVYNGSNYLNQAIDSALEQSYKNIEVIVVNDGSCDDGKTDRMARSYGNKIRYFKKENGGVATALNFAIQKMTGEYFSWLSHDDLYTPDKVEAQVKYINTTESDHLIPFCDSEKIDSSGAVIAPVVIKKAYINNNTLLVLSTKVHGCSLLIPKKAFLKVGMFNEALRNTQDVEMWLRLVVGGYQFQYTHNVKVKGRVHRQQTSRSTLEHHQIEKTNYFKWTLDVIDIDTLLKNKKEILRILFIQNQLSVVRQFITILQENRAINGIGPTIAMGTLILSKKSITGRLNTIPTYVSITHKIKQRWCNL